MAAPVGSSLPCKQAPSSSPTGGPCALPCRLSQHTVLTELLQGGAGAAHAHAQRGQQADAPCSRVLSAACYKRGPADRRGHGAASLLQSTLSSGLRLTRLRTAVRVCQRQRLRRDARQQKPGRRKCLEAGHQGRARRGRPLHSSDLACGAVCLLHLLQATCQTSS